MSITWNIYNLVKLISEKVSDHIWICARLAIDFDFASCLYIVTSPAKECNCFVIIYIVFLTFKGLR